MKKLLAVLAFAGLSLSGFAQDATPTEKYSVATNSFWSNWFIQAGAEWNAWYSIIFICMLFMEIWQNV